MKHIIKQVNSNQILIPHYTKLLDVYEGNLNYYVSQSLQQELSPESFKVASTRIPSVNILRRIIKKLSKVYTDEPNRTTIDQQDQEIITNYLQTADIQSKMGIGEELLNLHKCFALEPYVANGTINLRVLAPHEFTVFSDDKNNPNHVTHFIKYMGSYQKQVDHKIYIANIYWVYTNEFMYEVDSDGDVLSYIENIYKTIPFIYVNSSPFSLIPQPDNDSFGNSLLVPKLLCDLNYATQFQSHSIMYGINVDMQGKANGSPDSFWNLTSKGDGSNNNQPSVGVLSPSVDTDKVLSLIGFTISQWLESRGIKPGSIGTLNTANAASGVSKMIDEADTSQVVQSNRILLVKAESKLWSLIAIIHNTLLGSPDFSATKGLSENLQVSVSFPVQLPITDPQAVRDDLKFKLENKLISYIRALKEANPNLNEDEILKLKAEIEAETQINSIKSQDNQPINTNIIK